jgi:hypothetical protein
MRQGRADFGGEAGEDEGGEAERIREKRIGM